MTSRALAVIATVTVGIATATAALADPTPSVHQARWEKCYRGCEASYGTNETGRGKGFKACVARCEDRWLSTSGAPPQR